MGQQEVYDLLKKHRKKWLSTKEIIDKLRLSSGSVTASLKKLRKAGMVDYKLAKLSKESGKRKVYVHKFRG